MIYLSTKKNEKCITSYLWNYFSRNTHTHRIHFIRIKSKQKLLNCERHEDDFFFLKNA